MVDMSEPKTSTEIVKQNLDLQPRVGKSAFTRLLHKKTATLGLVLCALVVLCAVLAPVIAPYDPLKIDTKNRLQGPSVKNWFGTDELGRDVLSRIIYGSRISLRVGVISIIIALTVGTPLGLVSGFYGGALDSVIMRTMDALAGFPSILLALAIVSALGPSVQNAMIAIGIAFLPAFSRLTRGNVLSAKENEYVTAARALGVRNLHLMFRTILPNVLAPVLVHASIGFANAIIIEAGLSFLGLGAQPPQPSWGAMLQEARQYMNQTVWYSITAGMAIFFSVLGLNLIGDGLRDVLDPRLRGRD
jgi:peptide/nickel transport system permease protein